MNETQKWIVTVGVTLVLLSGLFPPYEEKHVNWGGWTKDIGYHFLFLPPDSRSGVSVKPVLSRVLLQVVIIVIATLGLVWVGGSRTRGSFDKRDGGDSQ